LLFRAHFTERSDPGDRDLLVRLAVEAGLDGGEAKRVLESGTYAEEVREREQEWIRRGVRSVPTIVFDNSDTMIGGQSPAAFETLIRQLLAERPIG
jgi:predicted DsbA family dithiol-disulfide isomerase